MKQIPAPLLTLVIGVVVTLISFWVGQNHHFLPVQASLQAPLVDNFFDVMVTIGTALFLVVEGTIVFCLIKFRRRAGDDTDGLPIEGNLPLEAFWTAIPALIVIGLGIYSVEVFQEMGGMAVGHQHGQMAHQTTGALVAQAPSAGDGIVTDAAAGLLGDSRDQSTAEGTLVAEASYGFGSGVDAMDAAPDLVVNVTGLQFAWIFNYPESGITDGELHVPVGQDVLLNLSAQDVIHSLWIPQFRLKQDAIPGQESQLQFIATEPGTYPIVCAELCGSYHGGMRTQIIVHTPEEYDAWLASRRVAQQAGGNQVVALETTAMSETEYLKPFSDELSVSPEMLHGLHHAQAEAL